ncbi:MAG: RICIN domain-containing protein [Rhodospirillales bacterium]|nr:RICIN domain-containing protein [Rhodospirillales bacterium]
MGISFLDLKNLTLDIKKQKVGTTRTYNTDIGAIASIGRHSNLDINLDVVEEGGHITDVFFKLDGPLSLADIPEVNKVPNADKLKLSKLIISENGIEADTNLRGHKTDFFAFYDAGWNVAMSQTDFNLGELIPAPAVGNLLKEITFPFAAVMLSESGLNKPYKDLSKVGQDALKDIFSNPNDKVNIKKGLAFAAGFHPKNSGKLGKHLKGMGVHSGIVVMGEVGGFFGGTPSFTLAGILASAGASKLPSFMSFIKNEQLDFFISATEEELEIGLDIDLTVKIMKDTLTFDTKVVVKDVDGGDLGIGFGGGMQGTWDEPFDIPKLKISDAFIDATLSDSGLELGINGSTTIGTEKIALTSDIQFSELLIPDAAAFKGSISEVDIFVIEELATKVLGKAFKFDIPQGVFPKFKAVSLAFVSPGAVDTDLGLNSEGFGMSGQMSWLGHDKLGLMKVSVSPTSGIYADGDIKQINIGPLELKENHFKIDVGIKQPVPKITLTSKIDIKYLELHENFDIVFDSKGVKFDAEAKITDDLSFSTEFKLSGIDLSVTDPGFKDADFSMEGDLTMDIGAFIATPMQDVSDIVFNELKSGFASAEAAVTKAKTKVDHLTAKINAERAKVRKERQAAEKKVEDAKKRVDHLYGQITKDWASYHNCSGWFGFVCRAEYDIRIIILKAAVDIAEEALTLTASLIDHFPLDLDPRVGILIGERDVADAVLDVVKLAIEGLNFYEAVQAKVNNEIIKIVKGSANITKSSFAGDLGAIFKHDAPVVLSLEAEILGAKINQTLPFKLRIKDIPYDVKQMGVIGVKSLWHVVESLLGDVPLPSSLKHKIRKLVVGHVQVKADAIKAELKTAKTKYAQYAGEQDAILGSITAQNHDYMKKDHYASVVITNPLDHRATETFSNEFIEAGHTGLCLDDVNGEIRQDKCTDSSSSRWSVVAANADTKGYQNIIDDGTKKCIVPKGKWTSVTKTYTSPKFGNTDSFQYKTAEFSGDGHILVRNCKDSEEFKWKILPHGNGGDGWLQIANKVTGQCLHFTNSSALPGQAVAEWQPCVGSANQVFRVADKMTSTYHKVGFAMRNDQLGICVGEAAKDGTVSMGDCSKTAWYDYMVNYKGQVKIINRRTGHCLQPSGYEIGAKMTEVPCTQLDYQWWDVTDFPGGFLLKNAQTKQCTQPPLGDDLFPRQVDCKDRHNSLFTGLGDPNQGPHWNAGYKKAGVNFAYPNTKNPFDEDKPVALCTAKDKSGGLTSGVFYGGDGLNIHMCTINLVETYKGKLRSRWENSTHFSMITHAPDTEFVPNTGGKLPENAIATGGFGTAISYTCRVKMLNYNDDYSTYLGWTTDGKTCVILGNSANDSGLKKDFEIFVRSGGIFRFNVSSPGVVTSTPVTTFVPLGPPMKTAPVWVVGPGNSPYAWDAKDYKWVKQKGCIKQISVKANGYPVGIKCNDDVAEWNGKGWLNIGSYKAHDVGAGGGEVYIIDWDGNPRQWTGSKWVPHAICAKRIDVLETGLPVIAACDGLARYLKNSKWVNMLGGATEIGTSGAANTWIVGAKNHAFKWRDGKWWDHGGCLTRIDVAKDGTPWGISCTGQVLSLNGSSWNAMRSIMATDIGMQP